jgi:hypothetical protein
MIKEKVMVIKPAKYKKCKECGRLTLIKDERICCDGCRKELDIYNKGNDYLDSRLFDHDVPSKNYHFCSWKCFFKVAKKMKCDYFMHIPYLHYDRKGPTGAAEFWKLVKRGIK